MTLHEVRNKTSLKSMSSPDSYITNHNKWSKRTKLDIMVRIQNLSPELRKLHQGKLP